MYSFTIVLSQFKQTSMLLIDHTYIRGDDLTDYAMEATRNLLYAYIDAHILKLIYEYLGYVVQAIMILQLKCANMNFSDKSKCNRLFQQVLHKEGESEINYAKIS